MIYVDSQRVDTVGGIVRSGKLSGRGVVGCTTMAGAWSLDFFFFIIKSRSFPLNDEVGKALTETVARAPPAIGSAIGIHGRAIGGGRRCTR